MSRIHLAVALVVVLAFAVSSSHADVTVRLEVKDSGQKAGDAAVPVMSVETVAGSKGNFAATTKLGKQTIELKGSLKKSDDGKYLVKVTFSDRAEGSTQMVSTNIIVPLSKPQEIGGLAGAGAERKVVLILEGEPGL